MDLPPTLEGRFLRRENRFRVVVELDGRPVAAHLPNSGRLAELLEPGRICYLVSQEGRHRCTAYDLVLVEWDGVLVSVDARLPGRLVAESVLAGRLFPWWGVTLMEAEVRWGRSRLDLRFGGVGGSWWVEAKSVTLVEDGVALFPDAPTERGRRHLEELRELVRRGERAAVVFVVQRGDAVAFAPNVVADPGFARLLGEVGGEGVGVHAVRCRVARAGIEVEGELPVVWGRSGG